MEFTSVIKRTDISLTDDCSLLLRFLLMFLLRSNSHSDLKKKVFLSRIIGSNLRWLSNGIRSM